MSNPERDPPAAVIFGCAGLTLSEAERTLFRNARPLGFILFARNCRDPDQVRRLVVAMREAVGREDAPVLIDQEGGRVARLGPPHWRKPPPARIFGELAGRDREAGREAALLNARLIGRELAALGVTVDCAPVLDLPAPDGHDIIGDRAFGDDPTLIADLGRAVCDGLLAEGVVPVVKHVPGHGRARADSHLALPTVAAPLDDLRRTDFVPFRALADAPWAMTAHIVYSAVDDRRAASVSPAVIERVVRGEIGFDGLLVSDDLDMRALAGPVTERAEAVLAAGCDVALHCSGRFDDMAAVAAVVPPMSEAALIRLARSDAQRRTHQSAASPEPSAAIAARLDAHISSYQT